MALLRFHHARFEDGMVRSFQQQQVDAIRNWTDSLQGQVGDIRRELDSLAGQPDVRRFAPGMKETLESFLARESATLDDLEVLSAGGATLWSGLSSGGVESRKDANEAGTLTPRGEKGRRLSVSVPIELDGKRVGTLRAGVNVYSVLVRCQPKANSTYRSLHCVICDTGEVVYGGDTIAKPRQVVHVMPDPDAPKATVDNVGLLTYVTDRCVAGGGSGLAETVRQDGQGRELIAFSPINLEGRRFGLVMGSPRANVSVPIASHERVTYALIVALALLYFATGYTAYRSERAHTQLEEARRRAAEEASRAKGNFLAQMSHELRTPMNGVISMTDLALDSTDHAQRQKYLEVVKECANSLLSVINDILDLSKIEAGKLELRHVLMSVPQCVAGTLASLASLAKNKGLSLRWEIDPGAPTVVLGDPGRLRQVLNNLIGNAIKFTTSGEVMLRVTPISVQADEVVVQFSVHDTGPGMSLAEQKRLFTPYNQGQGNREYRRDSTGLGLSIVKRLVELMGGRVRVESEPGKGTVMVCTARFGPVLEAGAGIETAALPMLAGLRVLVISRAQGNLQRLRSLMGSWGAWPSCVADVEAALSSMKKATDQGVPFGLVLLDACDLPSRTGEFSDRVVQLGEHEGAALVVAFCAALRADAVRCLGTLIDAYLDTSASDYQLHVTLRLALQHAAQQRNRPSVAQHPSSDGPSLSILLVDDNPINQQAASLMLSQWRHRVCTAGSGQEALAVLARQKFDLVLMDLEMPGMSGIEATERIRQSEKGTTARAPIVAMTAHAMDSDRARCLECGMDDFLSKPFRPEQLRGILAKTIAGMVGKSVPPEPSAVEPVTWDRQDVWNRSEALRMADGNEKAVSTLIGIFLQSLRETLPAAQEAAVKRDGKTLGRLAHRWKGALGLIGAKRALTWAVRLEEVCNLGEPQRLLECFQNLHAELILLEQALSLAEKGAVTCKYS
jgi:protein-histidine pros-kinase